MEGMDDIVSEFLAESRENLDALDSCLLALERGEQDPSTVAEIFRTVHTIKGTCGFLGLVGLEALAHAAESLLARVRDAEVALTQPVADTLLATVDAVRGILADIEAGRGEVAGEQEALVGRLDALNAGSGAGEPPAARTLA